SFAKMGSTVSSAMDESMKKNQEFMKETQQLQANGKAVADASTNAEKTDVHDACRLKRNVHVASIFLWYCYSRNVCRVRYVKTKNPAIIAPFIPLSFIVGYQADYAYGNKVERIRDEAERIMKDECSLLTLPNGLPSFQDIEEGRKATESQATK
ncbi:hypothetical protein QZH41_016067, partial [Actinostola sp. cb2023]